ncbi:hypothetical protein NFI96_002902 [Prochilodus magdalenae]|nr:hypothetical protein NFI96_002902 [Prochilodus magdalenae]
MVMRLPTETRLRKFGLPPDILTNFYRCTIESILMACITVWYGSCTAYECKALKRVVRTAEFIIGSKLPDLQDIYQSRCLRKLHKNRLDCSHPAHSLFTLLLSGRKYCSIQARTNRLINSFYPQAIRFLNKLSDSIRSSSLSAAPFPLAVGSTAPHRRSAGRASAAACWSFGP